MKQKYLKNKSVASMKSRVNDSPCWKAPLKVTETYFSGRKVNLKSGNIMRFWLDPWSDENPLCLSHPRLFDISLAQEVTFQHVLKVNLNVHFRRHMTDTSQTYL
jgi:hypothetical protein